MFRYSVQYVHNQPLAVLTGYFEENAQNLHTIFQSNISHEFAKKYIDVYEMQQPSHDFWITPKKWIPPPHQITLEQSSGKLVNVPV